MNVEDTRIWMRKGIYFSWHTISKSKIFTSILFDSQVPRVMHSGPDGYYTYSRNPGLKKEPKSFIVAMILPELCPRARHLSLYPKLFAIQTSLTTKTVPLLALRDILDGLLPFLPVLQAEA